MLEFWALTSKGVEELLADEVRQWGGEIIKLGIGVVRFNAELKSAYQLCLWSRLATRILRHLSSQPVTADADLYQVASHLNWPSQMRLNQSFAVECVGKHPTIDNTQYGAQRVKDVIVDQFRQQYEKRPDVDRADPDLRFQVRLEKQFFHFLQDFSGPSLHQRGYRKEQGQAPLKEHLAAALIKRSGWNFDQPLYDPFCGSGTLLIEAVLMARHMAPGLKRIEFAFERWPGHQETLWQQVRAEAFGARKAIADACLFIGSDNDERTLQKARKNAETAGVADFIEFRLADATQLTEAVAGQPGVVLTNPPYGERLSEMPALIPVYADFALGLKKFYQGWRLAIITSSPDLLRALKLSRTKTYKFSNGPLDCDFTLFDLTEKQVQSSSSAPALFFAESESFANRLKKNLKQLEKWAKREGISCYRLYDADIPEYNVAVDWYDGEVVVHEYAAPANVDEHIAQKRLFDVVNLTPRILEVPSDKLILKVREKQKGKDQYQALNRTGQHKVVNEYNAKFYVNLRDYLDTGLFLDHRTTRLSIQRQSAGKRVLNLFAYTGSASVHAALGGAKTVTTVDMSNTYLDWAKRNFELNDLTGKQYQFVQDNVLDWLKSCKNQFDLVFVDPPTFSNSKRMEDTWDVQRDHLKLLTLIGRVLAPGAKVIFSNNKRRFKLDSEALQQAGWSCKDISAASLPEDFKRNPNIHVCFELTRADA